MSSSQNQGGRMSPERNRLIQILSHPAVWPTFNGDSQGKDAAARYVDRYLYDSRYRVFLPEDGTPAVIVAMKKYRWLVEAYVAATPEGRGEPVRRLAAAARSALKKEGVEKAIGYVDPQNVRCARLMRELGFVYRTRVDGKKKSVEVWGLDL